MLADLVSGESPLLGLQIKFLAVCAHGFFVVCLDGERGRALVSFSFLKRTLIPS